MILACREIFRIKTLRLGEFGSRKNSNEKTVTWRRNDPPSDGKLTGRSKIKFKDKRLLIGYFTEGVLHGFAR